MKTPQELKEIVKSYCALKGWEPTDQNVEEVLLYGDAVFEQQGSKHRWWNDTFRVVNVAGTLIGCTGVETTGDAGPRDVGWMFDWNSLCEVKAKEVITTVYEKVAE